MPFLAYILFLVVVLWPLDLFAETESGNNVALTKLEQFMSNPPTINEVTFRYIGLTARTNYCLMRWQTNGFLLLSYADQSALESHGESNVDSAYGRYDNSFWCYSTHMSPGVGLYERTSESLAGEKTNTVFGAYSQGVFIAARLMNMGIPNAGIGSIRWNDDKFISTNYPGIIWTGSIRVADGIPTGIQLSVLVLSNNVTYEHEVHYKYGQLSRQTGLPEEFDQTYLHAGEETRLASVKIYSMSTNNSILGPGDFDYNSVKHAITNLFWMSTGGQIYMSTNADPKTFVPIRKMPPGTIIPYYGGSNFIARRTIWVVAVVFFNVCVTATFGLFRRLNNPQKS